MKFSKQFVWGALLALAAACGGTIDVGPVIDPPDSSAGGTSGRGGTSGNGGSAGNSQGGTIVVGSGGSTGLGGYVGAGGYGGRGGGAGYGVGGHAGYGGSAGRAGSIGAGGSAGAGGFRGTGGVRGTGGILSGAGGGAGNDRPPPRDAGRDAGGADAGSPCTDIFGAGACSIAMFCDYSGGTCGLGQGPVLGSCQPRPQLCPLDCPGVCGCNHLFYCNACLAHVAGTDDSADTSCFASRPDSSSITCGGIAGAVCPAGMFCDFANTAQCGAADQTGVCQPRPQGCTADCPGACGCDGRFYCNACGAHAAGTDDSPSRDCISDASVAAD